MNRILIFLLPLIISTTAIAQKGTMYAGGHVGYSNIKMTDFTFNNATSRSTDASISPEVGMFIANDFTLGLDLNFILAKAENDISNTDYDKLTSIYPGIYIRKLWPIEDVFSIFVGLDVNFSASNQERNRNNTVATVYKSSRFGANLNIGIVYPLSTKFTAFGKYGIIGYTSGIRKDDSGAKEFTFNELGLNVNTTGSPFNIGLYYTFLSK